MAPETVYLDNNATTRPDEAVVEAMLPWLGAGFGNASSPHARGREAADALAAARSSVQRLVGARSPREVVFTAGGTESDNQALHAALHRRPDGVVLTTAVEHAAVLKPLERRAERGGPYEAVGVDGDGRLDLERLLARVDELGERCALVSVMWANNETGVVNPREALALVGDACRRHRTPFHVDAVQAVGKLPLDVAELPVDLLSISGHKFHGPKGAGALYVDAGFERGGFEALLQGGGHERERRAGTENVPALVGLGVAAERAREHAADAEALARLGALRNRLEDGLLASCPGAVVHASGAPRVANTSSVRFPGVDGEALLLVLDGLGVQVSTGSACDANHQGVSHVLLAMGLSEAEAGATIRFSLSRRTTPEEVDAALERVPGAVALLAEPAS